MIPTIGVRKILIINASKKLILFPNEKKDIKIEMARYIIKTSILMIN